MSVEFATRVGAAGLNIECPTGKRIRLLSMAIDLSIPVEGDQLIIVFSRSIEQFLRIPSPALTTVMLGINAGIGLGVVTNPYGSSAAGVVVFGQVLVQVSMPLPDIWWEFTIGVSIDAASGTTFNGWVATYEITNLPRIYSRR